MIAALVALFLLLSFAAGFALLAGRRSLAYGTGFSSEALKDLPSVSLVIPARNESDNLKQLFASLEPHREFFKEIIVVNDNSADDTAQVATRFGARVLNGSALPQGWTGKNWACHQGAIAAQGELLFFLDADCFFKAHSVSKILSLYKDLQAQHSRVALSVLPYHETRRFYESFSAFFNIMMAAGSTKLVGQSLLIAKADYLQAGGHEAVKEHVLENFFMTEKLRAQKIYCETFLGKNVLHLRMFPEGIHQLIEGWTKAFSRGAKHTDSRTLGLSILWLFSFPVALLSGLVSTPLMLAASCACALQLSLLASRVGSFGLGLGPLFPLHWIFYQVVFTRSALLKGKQKTWKGRSLA